MMATIALLIPVLSCCTTSIATTVPANSNDSSVRIGSADEHIGGSSAFSNTNNSDLRGMRSSEPHQEARSNNNNNTPRRNPPTATHTNNNNPLQKTCSQIKAVLQPPHVATFAMSSPSLPPPISTQSPLVQPNSRVIIGMIPLHSGERAFATPNHNAYLSIHSIRNIALMIWRVHLQMWRESVSGVWVWRVCSF